MAVNRKLKTVPLGNMIDKHVGKIGSARRDVFEKELRLELLGQAIKETKGSGTGKKAS